ncbi:MAG: hypothetical protein PsegKO_30650 [Pseudohongiellaceae bacterium]
MKATSIFILLLLASNGFAQQQQVQLFPITDVVPEYPTEAIVQEQEGWVLISLDVSSTGNTSNIRIVDSEPRLTFDQAALDAGQRLRFEPYTENGIAQDVSGLQYVFRFELSEIPDIEVPDALLSLNDAARESRARTIEQRKPSVTQIANEDMIPLSTIPPEYPPAALEQNVGGWVLLRFSVSDSGDVIDPVVEDSEPANVFDETALDAVQTFKYEAGGPEEDSFDRLNVFHLFKFRPST